MSITLVKETTYEPTSKYTNRSVTHTFDPTSTHYRFEIIGGGGAGQGAASGSGNRASAGSPGGSAAYYEHTDFIPITGSLSLMVGKAAQGKTPQSGVNADDGGNSTLTDPTLGTWEMTGGSGGQQETSDTPPYFLMNSNGRAGLGTDPSGNIISAGQRGGICIAWAEVIGSTTRLLAWADGGASSAQGRAFEGIRIYGQGRAQSAAAVGAGAGGGGAVCIDSTAIAGTDGGVGRIKIKEYILT